MSLDTSVARQTAATPVSTAVRASGLAAGGPRKPRLGFLGLGWIGLQRMRALAASGLVDVAAVADSVEQAALLAAADVPGAQVKSTLDDLLSDDIDAVVIATPSALHAQQAIAALEAEKAVFCQKPLGRHADEVRQVIAAARRANRLLGVDFCYRYLAATQHLRHVLSSGEIGEVFAIEATFHNAHGPDKPWFYDRALSGGGCVIDLGVHLIDLVLWLLAGREVTDVHAHLFAHGKRLAGSAQAVEDYAAISLELDHKIDVKIACSWNLPAGQNAVIGLNFFGTRGGLSLHNVDGSFYDFEAERLENTRKSSLHQGPDEWGGRAAIAWAEQLTRFRTYNPEVERAEVVANVIDRIYGK
jgi:predicted dehydrogenase